MRIVTIGLIIALCACSTVQNTKETEALKLAAIKAHVDKGVTLLNKNALKASNELDGAIKLCEERYNNSEQKTYASRGMTETLLYTIQASAAGISAIVTDTLCSDSFYLKGYASLDLGRLKDAEKWVTKAIEMAPANARYQSELGHIYHIKKDWEAALKAFEKAEKHAESFSPENVKNSELARAKRGVGFSLIELGRLSEAEEKFKACLEINPNDEMALRELKYIDQLRKTKKNNDA